MIAAIATVVVAVVVMVVVAEWGRLIPTLTAAELYLVATYITQNVSQSGSSEINCVQVTVWNLKNFPSTSCI